jgi:methionyl-tRNA formyltransferase
VLKIFRTAVTSLPSSQPPGTLTVTPAGFTVATGDVELAILELQQEGRKRMGVSEFLRGTRLTSGMKLL